jgi:hypothetical protein
MKWHIAHRHEIPAAFDALGKDHETKTADIQEENIQLKRQLGEIQRMLEETIAVLKLERAARTEAEARVLEVTRDRDTAIMAVVIRDTILKERLGICLKNPFKKDQTT